VPLTGAGATELESRCELLRSLHVPGDPLVLPNAWDVATARAVVEAGYPAVATTSGGVAAALGYEDHEAAPAEEMLAAAARIAGGVDVPTTVDAESGYGLEPADLVAALGEARVAGCNLEDTDHSSGTVRTAFVQAERLAAVREAARKAGYPLVINARIDVFLADFHGGAERPQAELVDEALGRARAYFEAGVDCVYPIALWQPDALRAFVAGAPGPVNALAIPRAPSPAELGELGVARVSWGGLLQRASVEWLSAELASLTAPEG
jgi:2-methylisocitrate lyase-like PEP mutase family enzyme